MNEQTPYTNEPTTAPVEVQATAEVQAPAEKKIWKIFAKLSFIFGFVGLAGAFIPFFNIFMMEINIVGLVFGILGKKSPSMCSKAKTGIIVNIIAAVLCFVMHIIYSAVMGAAIGVASYY